MSGVPSRRLWNASDRRIWRTSVNGDLPGAEDEFPCLSNDVARRLSLVLNEEGEAERRLLAELVEALRDCIRHINEMGRALDTNNVLPDYIPQLDDAERVSFKAEAAIAKATGEPSS